MNVKKGRSVMAGMVLVACCSLPAAFGQEARTGADASPARPERGLPLFATVNGKPVTQAEFHSAYATFLRQKYYHGQVPQDKLAQARQEVGDKLIERILLVEEADRRGIVADAVEVEKQIQAYDQRYATNANWQQSRAALLPGLRQQLEQQSRLARLEQAVREIPEPTPEQVKAFYASKPELFTEPEKLRLHVIMLAVAPSSGQAIWDAAMREAEAIVKRIRGGADFAELARLSSQDESAEKGGDMGYLHRGMLPEALQVKIDQFKFGEVGDPIPMLQGIGVFRLDDRIPPKLQEYGRVAERAKDLLYRELKDKAWQDTLARLRSAAVVVIHESAAPGSAN